MFIICFTNSVQSNVDVRSCLVSLFGLSVALFSTVFYFCKVTDLASHFFPFLFIFPITSSLLSSSRCCRAASRVCRLCWAEVSPARLLLLSLPLFILSCSSTPLFDHFHWGCQLFDPSHLFEGTRLVLSQSPAPRRALASAAKATRVPPPSLKTTYSHKVMDKIMRTCRFPVTSWKKTNWGLENSSEPSHHSVELIWSQTNPHQGLMITWKSWKRC